MDNYRVDLFLGLTYKFSVYNVTAPSRLAAGMEVMRSGKYPEYEALKKYADQNNQCVYWDAVEI